MEKDELIKKWNNGLKICHKAHSMAFSHYKRLEKIMGLSATLSSALVGTTVFASLSKSDNSNFVILAGCFSILSTVLVTANSFLKYGEIAEKHNQAMASFGNLRREFENKIINEGSEHIAQKFLEDLNTK